MIQAGKYFMKHAESVFLIAALIWLFFMQPNEPEVSLCFFRWLGIAWCPGCGIGHSIHYALHAQFETSVNHHILGIPAIVLMMYRVMQLLIIRKQPFI